MWVVKLQRDCAVSLSSLLQPVSQYRTRSQPPVRCRLFLLLKFCVSVAVIVVVRAYIQIYRIFIVRQVVGCTSANKLLLFLLLSITLYITIIIMLILSARVYKHWFNITLFANIIYPQVLYYCTKQILYMKLQEVF